MGQYIYGRNTVKSALKEGKVTKLYLLSTIRDREIEQECDKKGIKITYKTIKELDQMSSGVHQGIVAEVVNYEFVNLDYLIQKAMKEEYQKIYKKYLKIRKKNNKC